MTLKLNVTGRTMPELAARRFYIDFWQHPAAVARVEGCRLWSDEHFSLLEKYMRPLADLGQRTVTATLNKDPWNHQCYDLHEDMILWTRDIDGTWSYDYTVFDRWVELMDSASTVKSTVIRCFRGTMNCTISMWLRIRWSM